MTPHDLDHTRPAKALNYAMEILDEDSLRDSLRDYGLHEAARKLRHGATSPGRPGYASATIESPAPGPRVNLHATDVSGGHVPAGRVSLSATFGVYASAWTVTTSLTGDPAVDEELLLAALAALNLYFWTFHPEDAEDLTGRTRAADTANRLRLVPEDELRDIFREED